MARQYELGSCGQCLKYVMFASNFIFFLMGCVMTGLGIWMLIERDYMSAILGTALMTVAIFIVIIAGAVIIIITFFGCVGAMTQNKCMLLTYFTLLLLIFLILIVAGILAIVFRSQLGDQIRNTMRNSLQNQYGVNLEDSHNRAITESWDKVQERLYCCAIEDRSWNAYRASEWFKIQPGVPEVNKPYVPLSCCVKNQYGRYVSQEKCQTWNQGPPRLQSGLQNEGLHYRGCYQAGREFLWDWTAALIGMGIGVGLFMVSGLVFAVCLYRQLDY